MEQISFFDNEIPQDFDSFYAKVCERLAETHDKADVFSMNTLKSEKDCSIYFYHSVVFRLRKRKNDRVLVIDGIAIPKGRSLDFAPIASKTANTSVKEYPSYTFILDEHFDMELFLSYLKDCKMAILRSLGAETFACCNDFMKCSDHKACIHPHDVFYNHCSYRINLEKGFIFYGKNRNI